MKFNIYLFEMKRKKLNCSETHKSSFVFKKNYTNRHAYTQLLSNQ